MYIYIYILARVVNDVIYKCKIYMCLYTQTKVCEVIIAWITHRFDYCNGQISNILHT